MKKAGLVLAIGGLHGTGKTTYARTLAQQFNLRHVSAGAAFRKIAEDKGLTLQELACKAEKDTSIDQCIDAAVKEEAKLGSVVIDGQLAAWMAGDNADLKIYLTAPDKVRFERIARRDGLTLQDAENITRERETREMQRFRKLYGIDLKDLSVYHLIVDTSLLSMEDTMKTLKNIVSDYIQEKGRKRY
ncbi:MAG: AAA family ATPase [Candidatus Bathyarchaeia archaeon]